MERTFMQINRSESINHIVNNSVRVGNELHLKEGVRTSKKYSKPDFELPIVQKTVMSSQLHKDPKVLTYHKTGTLEDYIIRTKPW